MIRDLILELFTLGGRDRHRACERERMSFGKRIKHQFQFHLRGPCFAT